MGQKAHDLDEDGALVDAGGAVLSALHIRPAQNLRSSHAGQRRR